MDIFNSREAPSHVVRALRELDPSAHLLYLGSGKWLLCLQKGDNSERRNQAFRALARLDQTMLAQPKGLDLQKIRQKARFLELMYRGFQAVDTYEFRGAPDSSVVHDYKRALWRMQHESEKELLDSLLNTNTEGKAAAHRDLTDTARHNDAWRYAFTRSHAVTRRDDPDKQAQQVKTGRIRHTIPKTAA